MVPGWRDEQCDRVFVQRALEFIDRQAEDRPGQPFLLYLTPAAPHRPCMPPEFAKGKSQAGPRGDMVWVVDWMVGQILEALDRHALADNTLVVVTSDNGAQMCDVDGLTYGHKSCGELHGYKADIWDGGHREPFIVRWPGVIQPGSACHETICLGDLLATLADILGADLPPNAAEDSYSFLPLLRQDETWGPRPPVIHHSWTGMFAIRDGRWKCIFGLGSGGFSPPQHGYSTLPDAPKGQLYDMADDWREQFNLWNKHPRVVERLEELLEGYKATGRSV
jgi:arylsulfatase A-like enzyme